MDSFYVNTLRDQRLENYQFLLDLSQYVWQKDKVVEAAQPELQVTYLSKFTPDIGDTVLHFVNELRRNEGFFEEIRIIVNTIHSEECSGVGKTRDYVFDMAYKYILEDNSSFEFRGLNACTPPYPFTDDSTRTNSKVRDYLLPKFNLCVFDEIIGKNFYENVERSLFSPAMIQVEKFVDFYGLFLRKNYPRTYFEYFAAVFMLLLEVGTLEENSFAYHILGEVEHVMNVHKETFPGYESLNNYSSFKKSVQYSELEPIN